MYIGMEVFCFLYVLKGVGVVVVIGKEDSIWFYVVEVVYFCVVC